jgi:DNA-directed RNA polymerase alpha subunit
MMDKKEMLDQLAFSAMIAQVEKFGITNTYVMAKTAYRLATEMIEQRDLVHQEWENAEKQQRLYQTANLHELNLPIRYFNCLRAEDIYTKEQLCDWDIRELRKIPNLGAKGVRLVMEAMSSCNLKLKGQE